MRRRPELKKNAWLALVLGVLLSACASKPPVIETPVPSVAEEKAPPPPSADSVRIAELEKQLAERQKHCLDEKRRLEGTLKDTQKRLEDTQKKLKAVLALERSLRRGKEQ